MYQIARRPVSESDAVEMMEQRNSENHVPFPTQHQISDDSPGGEFLFLNLVPSHNERPKKGVQMCMHQGIFAIFLWLQKHSMDKNVDSLR